MASMSSVGRFRRRRRCHDLSRTDLERHAPHLLDASVVTDPQVLDSGATPHPLDAALFDPKQHFAPDHESGELLLGRTRGGQGLDDLAPSQDRDSIGDLEHFVQLVGDEDDRHPLALEAREDAEQLACLLRRQHGGRLVEDQDVRTTVERLQNFHPLLLTDGDVLDLRVRVDCEAERDGEILDPSSRGAVVEEDRPLARLHAEDDVLGHRHDGDEHEVLMHHADPVRDRITRRAKRHRRSGDPDLALVGPVEPVQHIHQRGLPGAVLAEQRVYLGPAKIDAHLIVGQDPGEPLGYGVELQDRGRAFHAARF